MRTFNVPTILLNQVKTDVTNKVFIAWSDIYELRPLNFELLEVDPQFRNWSQIQYNLETCRGAAVPRDMIYGFHFVDCPRWSKKNATEAFQRITKGVPCVKDLKKLNETSYLGDGIFIILIRMPRPVGSRNVVPFDFRKDVVQLRADFEVSKDDAIRIQLQTLESKMNDVHPTNAQLYLTKNKSLIQQVQPHISCTVCGALGHHMAHTHKDVVSEDTNEHLIVEYPEWMNVKPLPQEVLNIPTQEGGVEVKIRQITTTVPLRLARAMKLRGANVIGEVNKCGLLV
jgi:hypothetical protein